MSKPDYIAVVTVEWSDDYTGSELYGHFGGNGNERYIFLPHQGKYYGYIPPNASNFPKESEIADWLVFFVSRPSKNDSSVVVGWYENARIVRDTPRPDARKLGRNSEGGDYSYSAITELAVSIPVAARDCVLPKGDSLRSFSYVREGGEDRRNRVELVKTLLDYRKRLLKPRQEEAWQSCAGFPVDPIIRDKIEKAAVKAVRAEYKTGFRFIDKQKALGVGYDLEFTDKKTSEVWCIEVKGTAGTREAFFITRSERRASQEIWDEEQNGGLRRWRLALVTSALDPSRRRIRNFKPVEMENYFELQCLQWQAFPKESGSN